MSKRAAYKDGKCMLDLTTMQELSKKDEKKALIIQKRTNKAQIKRETEDLEEHKRKTYMTQQENQRVFRETRLSLQQKNRRQI